MDYLFDSEIRFEITFQTTASSVLNFTKKDLFVTISHHQLLQKDFKKIVGVTHSASFRTYFSIPTMHV